MIPFLTALLYLLFLNALIAFFIGFYWHGRVILKIFGRSDRPAFVAPWKALADRNSHMHQFGRFVAGVNDRDERRKWIRALCYAGISFACLFAYAMLLIALDTGIINVVDKSTL